MEQFEKVCKGLECCNQGERCRECPYAKTSYDPEQCIRGYLLFDALALIRQQQERIKELEHEISRLKQHVDCDAAEKIPSGCVGYGRGINDDEPCETCKECPEYNLYGVE